MTAAAMAQELCCCGSFYFGFTTKVIFVSHSMVQKRCHVVPALRCDDTAISAHNAVARRRCFQPVVSEFDQHGRLRL